ncbi:MAG: hypothetical protein JWN35_3864 [Frankiales bacterium]|nr:hypothetical protein [Frankiales bacterium]
MPRGSHRSFHARPSTGVLLALLGALVVSVLASSLPATAAPLTRVPGKAIEVYSPYQPQGACNPTAQPGTLALSRLVMAAYPGTGSSGIVVGCASGGLSEHKEGRAWDWRVNYANPRQRAQAADFTRWLFATDAFGNRFAQARRLGVMYVIWNKKIWGAYDAGAGWRPYTGSDPHTGHMHISLSWAGALKKTSYWTGAVAPVLRSPLAPARPTTPKPATPATPKPTTPKPATPAPAAPAPAPDGHDEDALPVLDSGERAFDVSSTDEGLPTPFVLQRGRRYQLTVSGTYAYGDDPMIADAECSRWPSDRRWHRRSPWEGGGSGSGHLDVSVNGRALNWEPSVDDGSGCDTTGHTYTLVVTVRRDGPLHLGIADDKRSDNAGSLHVVIRALDS